MRLIDADKLWMDIIHAMDYCDDILEIIERQPTVEPQKTGKWEQVTVTYCAELDDETKEVMAIASMFCPECRRYHNEVYLYGNPTYGVKYCPNCGSRMMEGEQDD